MAKHGIGDPRDLRIALAMNRRQTIVLGICCCAAVVHVGTAVLRLGAFLPFPQSVDFSAFYAAAHALRQGSFTHGLSADWLSALQHQVAIPSLPRRSTTRRLAVAAATAHLRTVPHRCLAMVASQSGATRLVRVETCQHCRN